MPTYEFRCRTCGSTFTESRPMDRSNDPATCHEGHSDTVRLLAVAGSVTTLGNGQAPVDTGGGGSCCGGGGCCG